MLRDAPRIYGLMFGIMAIVVLIMIWYANHYERGSDTLQLNEVILSSAVSEVDPTSRIYEGALLLSNTFEETVWKSLHIEYKDEDGNTVIKPLYPEGSIVQFDYMFDTEDDRFDNVEEGTKSSRSYKIGGGEGDVPDADNVEQASVYTGRPIKVIRVKVREAGDNVGDWTYTATVAVDAASRGE